MVADDPRDLHSDADSEIWDAAAGDRVIDAMETEAEAAAGTTTMDEGSQRVGVHVHAGHPHGDGEEEGEGEGEEEEADDDEGMDGGGVVPLLDDVPLDGLSRLHLHLEGTNRPMRDHDIKGRKRAWLQLRQKLQDLLRALAVGDVVAQKPLLWAVSAKYWRACKERRSEREALMKCVRGLSTSGWKTDVDLFTDLAQASIQLAQCALALRREEEEAAMVEGGGGGGGSERPRSNAIPAAKMQIKGLVTGARAAYVGHPMTAALEEMLVELEEV